jgi:hypothetical protein
VESAKALDRSLTLALQGTGYVHYDFQAMCALWLRQYTDAQQLANEAMANCQRNCSDLT